MQTRILCLAAMLWSGAALAGDWAYWRGPEHDGVSREQGLIEDWSLKSGTNVLWESAIGGRATPVILNGRVYLNCRTKDDVTDPDAKVNAREQVVCWDLASGEVLWKDVFNVCQTDIPAPRVGWASMTADPETENVYLHSVSGLFRCYDAQGKVLWEKSLFEDFGKISGYGGRTCTPIIDEDRVIVHFFGLSWGKLAAPPPKHTFYAFDKRTGKLLWTSAPGGPPKDTVYSNPIIRVINGQRMLICGNADGGCYAIHARSGQPIWGFRMSKRGLNASPVVEENRVYISHGEDNIDTVDFGRIQCIDATGSGDVTETHSKWRIDNIKAGYTGLLVKDGILYVVADTGNMHAFDSKTGRPLWEHNLGTVGKGSPVWADGKIYVAEVNGNVHILKPSREGCQTLSHVQIPAADGVGMDEIYASPAISEGRIVLVTRDRTLCLGSGAAPASAAEIPPLDPEPEPLAEPSLIHLVPAETRVAPGEKIDYEVLAYDKNGRLIHRGAADSIEVQAGLQAQIDGSSVSFAEDAAAQAGVLVAKRGDLSAEARVRVIPPPPWAFDFEGYTEKQVPPTWINAFLKLQPVTEDGNTFMRKAGGTATERRGRPSTYVWMGPPEMSGYTIQADVRLHETARRLPNIGITAQRYNLIIKGNYSKLTVQSWAPQLRMAKDVRFVAEPDKWYTMKMKVDVRDDVAHVLGKVWERGQEEPAEWTIEAVDPHPNTQGSPGLYIYALADSDFDNLSVTKE